MKINFSFKQFIVPQFWKKLILVLSACLLMGFFLSLLIEAGWGTDPCSFMNLNICRTIGWSLGNWQLGLNIVLFIFVFLFGGELIGFGTIANMTMIGYTVDLFSWVWKKCGFHDYVLNNSSFGFHLGLFIAAIVPFVISASIYMNSQMGVAPFDAIVNIIHKKISKVPFFIVRMAYDLTAVLIGFIASRFNPDGMQGSIIGSLVMSFLLGPTITLTGKLMNKLFFKNDSESEKEEIKDSAELVTKKIDEER